jgi:hypothetical protein
MRFFAMISFAPQTHLVTNIPRMWVGLRRAWSAYPTCTPVSDLTEAQLRDIGLLPDDVLQDLDQHKRYWHDRLSPWLDR